MNGYEQPFGGFLNRVSEVRVLPGAPFIQICIIRFGINGRQGDSAVNHISKRTQTGVPTDPAYLEPDRLLAPGSAVAEGGAEDCANQLTEVHSANSVWANPQRRHLDRRALLAALGIPNSLAYAHQHAALFSRVGRAL